MIDNTKNEAHSTLACRELLIVNRLGMHARAAARFAAVASRFDSQIHVVRGSRKVNGKSIMGLMMLAAAKGSQIEVCAEGKDAEAALNALESLVKNRFDEKE